MIKGTSSLGSDQALRIGTFPLYKKKNSYTEYGKNGILCKII